MLSLNQYWMIILVACIESIFFKLIKEFMLLHIYNLQNQLIYRKNK